MNPKLHSASADREAESMRKEFSVPMPAEYYASCKPPYYYGWIPKKPGFALEIGAARAELTYLLRRDGWGVVCGDIFDTLAHPLLCIQIVDKEHLPYDEGVFDLVATSNVLHHGSLSKTVREVHRVLKSGGLFVSFQEPTIPEGIDEAEYLKQHNAIELELGIDEHRPTIMDFKLAFLDFRSLEIFHSDNPIDNPPVKGMIPDQNHHLGGGIAIRAVK